MCASVNEVAEIQETILIRKIHVNSQEARHF